MQKSEPIVEYRNTFGSIRDQREGRQDRMRPINVRHVEFEVLTNTLVIEGEMYNAGVYSTEVYADRLPILEALVEKNPAMVAEAKRLYEAEEAAKGADKFAHRTFTSWPQAYGVITGGKAPGALGFLKVAPENMAPPASADELKAAATTHAIVDAVIKSQSASNSKK